MKIRKWHSILALSLVPCVFADPIDSHWSFQSINRPEVPEAAKSDSVSWFIRDHFAKAGLDPAPTASRHDWIRRIHYNLTGLPPDLETLESLLASKEDDSTVAKELVEQLLASPRYGEKWARLWLDVARYSDTKGYAYSPEEFNFPHAWLYRDWVIKAFNKDLAYDQFVQRQLAADLLLKEGLCDRTDLAAMGFLTLGRRFVSVEPDIIDDRIDVTTRGLLGLTVACARCHDHKYDPIPTTDYYALYGVFKSSRESLIPIDPEGAEKHASLVKAKSALDAEFKKQAVEHQQRYLERAAEYMFATLDLSKVPPPDFAEIVLKEDLNPAQIRRWYEFLSQECRRNDPVFAPWVALSEITDTEGFSKRAVEVLENLKEIDPLVRKALSEELLEGMKDVAACYATLLKRAAKADPDSEWSGLHSVVHGSGSPIRISLGYFHDVEWLFYNVPNKDLKKKLAELERAVIGLGEKAPHVVALVDREVPVNVRVFDRGHYQTQLEEVPRGSVTAGHGGRRPEFHAGSGRLQLARQITSSDNPLLARVIANRIWAAHFGEGLVRTESDFGLRSEPPSHPKLLDFLASELVDSGWSIKHLQRVITTSAVYRIKVGSPPEADPENRLLSVYPRRRLDFEAMRDSMLLASGELDLRMGGPPGELFGASASKRRSIYGKIDRQYLPSNLRVFDFANPELHAPRRYRTNVPQQALFLMNAPFTVARAKVLASRIDSEMRGDAKGKIRRGFELVYGRSPTESELANSLRFVSAKKKVVENHSIDPDVKTWSYGYGRMDQEKGQIQNFELLPHFNGEAWDGGANWPKGPLGWLQLTAEGGHTGHTTEHAAVRRWTSPVSGKLKLSGTLTKFESCGDGMRGWIISDRQGVVGAWRVEFGKPADTTLNLNVENGESLDFTVDCGELNNYLCDGFTWVPRIELADGNKVWDARDNFGGTRKLEEQLGAWERFAQALLISNEAMFLD